MLFSKLQRRGPSNFEGKANRIWQTTLHRAVLEKAPVSRLPQNLVRKLNRTLPSLPLLEKDAIRSVNISSTQTKSAPSSTSPASPVPTEARGCPAAAHAAAACDALRSGPRPTSRFDPWDLTTQGPRSSAAPSGAFFFSLLLFGEGQRLGQGEVGRRGLDGRESGIEQAWIGDKRVPTGSLPQGSLFCGTLQRK